MLPFQISIPRRSHLCAHGGETFEVGHLYYSVLKEGAEGLERLDFCTACWHQVKESYKSSVSWQSKVMHQKESSKDLFLNRDEKVFALLQNSPQTEEEKALTFIFALYLARRRLITLRKEVKQADGASYNLYEVNESEEMVMIPKVALTHLNIDALQKQIASLLGSSRG